MDKKEKSILYVGITIVFIVYLILIIGTVYDDFVYRELLSTDKPSCSYYVFRIFLFAMEHLNGIFVYVTCLCFLKNRKAVFGLCGVLSLLSLYVCLKYNLPLEGREPSIYTLVWEYDVSEYLYPVSFLWKLCLLLFFPALADILKKRRRGREICIWVAFVSAVSTEMVALIDNPVDNYYWSIPISFSPLILWTEVSILIFLSLTVRKTKDAKHKIKNKKVLLLKVFVPIVVLLIIFLSKVVIGKNYIVISEGETIDGYWFIGSVEGFIEQYENPYIDKRHYLEYEPIKERCLSIDWEGYRMFSEEKNSHLIITYERKLEGIYYLDEFEISETEDSDFNQVDINRVINLCNVRDYRVVLSSEKYEGREFHYEVIDEIPNEIKERYFRDYKTPRPIDMFDIAVGGKEIPAYFLAMVEKYHVVKVEPYVHYWREDRYGAKIPRIYSGGGLKTMRMY